MIHAIVERDRCDHCGHVGRCYWTGPEAYPALAECVDYQACRERQALERTRRRLSLLSDSALAELDAQHVQLNVDDSSCPF